MSMPEGRDALKVENPRPLLKVKPPVSRLLSCEMKNLKIYITSTAGRPTRAKKNYRPAQVVLDNTIQRRTSEQVKVDQAKAKKEAAAAEAATMAHKQRQLEQVAALEDTLQTHNDAQLLEDLRPDLQKSWSNTDVDTLSESDFHPMICDPISIFSMPGDPPMVIPLDTSSYRSLSQSEGISTG